MAFRGMLGTVRVPALPGDWSPSDRAEQFYAERERLCCRNDRKSFGDDIAAMFFSLLVAMHPVGVCGKRRSRERIGTSRWCLCFMGDAPGDGMGTHSPGEAAGNGVD